MRNAPPHPQSIDYGTFCIALQGEDFWFTDRATAPLPVQAVGSLTTHAPVAGDDPIATSDPVALFCLSG